VKDCDAEGLDQEGVRTPEIEGHSRRYGVMTTTIGIGHGCLNA
jgi:hypothetical protein